MYDKPISFFLEEQAVAEGLLLWRDKPAPPTSDRIQTKFDKLCKQYRNLEGWTNSITTDLFKELLAFAPAFPKDYPKVEALAHEVGKKMGLGERPGESLLRVLEEVYGIKVFHLDLGRDTSSACTYSDKYGAAILLNRNSKSWRRNFDLAHELFHIVTWESRKKEQVPNEAEERFANVFASRLLLPDEPFRDVVQSLKSPDGKITYDDLDSVARQFGVSLEAVLWRLSSLYGMPAERVRELIDKAKALSQLPARPNDSPPELPNRYRALAVKALRHGEISSAQFANYLSIGVSEVENYLIPNVPDPIQISSSNP
jgi:Zn-dependent peptidase ImmA (M78 family)